VAEEGSGRAGRGRGVEVSQLNSGWQVFGYYIFLLFEDDF